MSDINWIGYALLLTFIVITFYITIYLVKFLATKFIEGNTIKIVISSIITIILCSLLYSLCYGMLAELKIGSLSKKYNDSLLKYEIVKEEGWSDNRNAFVKNQMLYNFYHKADLNDCDDLSIFVGKSLQKIVAENSKDTDFMLQSKNICKLTKNYVNIEKQESCSTKDNGLICSIVHPLISLFNYEFKLGSVTPPQEDIEVKNEVNPLDEEEKLIKIDLK